ncbi:MAG TPA: tetratricopeptide repeat protein [Gemmatimonadaceae bacterium]|nr:tetratricopeptide repeat protein [Gemmatimonadaceae bacterium]
MKATTGLGALLLTASVVLVFPAAPAEAQYRSTLPADAPRFLVHTLRAPDKRLGVEAADELRERLANKWSRSVQIISKQSIETNLQNAGFDPELPPDKVTAQLLARNMRVDDFLEGSITPVGHGVRLETQLVLTRDPDMVQPLPPAEGSLADAVRQVIRSLEAARAQLPAEQKCENAIRDGKPQEAINHARAAIAAYPQSTIGRVCLANALLNAKAPSDSVIAVASKAVEIDAKNKPALAILAQAYKDKGNIDKAVEMWTQLVAADPKDPHNVQLQQQIANELARSGHPEVALKIISDAMQANPGDPDLTRLDFLLELAAKDWTKAAAVGEELARIDTASVDSTFFDRLARAYAADSQPQKAAETTARAVAKFPQNANLWSLHAQLLRSAGQNQQAVTAAQRAVELNPKVEHGWLRLAQAQIELGQSDSAAVSLRKAAQAGEDSSLVGQMMLVQGNQLFKQAEQSKTIPDYQAALRILSAADSLTPANASTKPQTKFLLGVTAFKIGDLATRQNAKEKSCELAQLAGDMFTTVQIELPQGGSASPEAGQMAGQLLNLVPQYLPAVEGQKKKFCK